MSASAADGYLLAHLHFARAISREVEGWTVRRICELDERMWFDRDPKCEWPSCDCFDEPVGHGRYIESEDEWQRYRATGSLNPGNMKPGEGK